jgi:hypothetical protein
MSGLSLVRKARGRMRKDGVLTLLSATRERLSDRFDRYRVARIYDSVPDGPTVIEVDPQRIERHLIEGEHPATSYRVKNGYATKHELDKAHFPIDRFKGRVVPGEWDRYTKPHRFDRVYVGVRERFVEGREWEDTEYGQHMLVLDDLYGHDFFTRRTERAEALYESMASGGYRPEPNENRKVAVNVGRDGEVIFNNEDGHHRLALAKTLGIDRIPVTVVVRHAEWQAIREAVAEADSIDDLGDREREHLDHPDVAPLHGFDGEDRSSTFVTGGLVGRAKTMFAS